MYSRNQRFCNDGGMRIADHVVDLIGNTPLFG